MRYRRLALFGVLLFLLVVSPAAAQEPFSTQDMQMFINAIRRANEAEPLAWSPMLAEAAQDFAEELATREEDLNHEGADGSKPEDRVALAGYVAYPDGVRASESFSTSNAMEAMAFFLESDVHRNNMLLNIWREVGIGHAESEKWGEVWVVVFGAQPGVLPIFINQDAALSTEPRVRVRLSTEEAGWSEEVFTIPVEVRVAEPQQLNAAPWKPWQSEVELLLSPEPGQKVVIAEYRDAQGRTVQAQDTIFLLPLTQGGQAQATPRSASPTRAATSVAVSPAASVTRSTTVPPTTPTLALPTQTSTVPARRATVAPTRS
nr:CAP domain-containing protein [Ardenticatenales bacterium]